jgi:hypothetical protein
MTMEIAAEIEALAIDQLRRIEALLPQSSMDRMAIFIEATRVIDFYAVNPPTDDKSGYRTINNCIVNWGWNPAAAALLSPLDRRGVFPLAASTRETRKSAQELLRVLGCNVLLRRGVQMLRSGLLGGERNGSGYVLESHEQTLVSAMLETLDAGRLEWLEGSRGSDFDQWHRDDLDELMLPLMRPWQTARGTMLAYDAIPVVDDHFLAEAIKLATKWREEAGIHPTTRLGEVTGSELMGFATFFASFHLKHAKFVSLAARHFPEISPVQSLTIWKPRGEFISDLAEFTRLGSERLAAIVDAIAFRADEAPALRMDTTPLRPLLIDLGNGLDLWPVSGLGRNPFETVRRIQERRDPSAIARLAAPREDWLRSDIQALFEGNRYERVAGNIKVKIDGRILTDIDAAIYDRVDDQLALFQIKWQDFSTNSPKEWRSKATNFMNAMNLWSDVVREWYQHIGVVRLMQKLRLRPSSKHGVTSVFLFGISRSVARLGPMAGCKPVDGLALANWHRFVRARLEIGPVDRVISRLHQRLTKEYEEIPEVKALPMTVEVDGRNVEFRDVFFNVDDS